MKVKKQADGYYYERVVTWEEKRNIYKLGEGITLLIMAGMGLYHYFIIDLSIFSYMAGLCSGLVGLKGLKSLIEEYPRKGKKVKLRRIGK